MLTKVGCVSICKLESHHGNQRTSHQREASYSLRCPCGIICQNTGSSMLNDDDIDPSNVVTERLMGIKTNNEICGNYSSLMYFIPVIG
jgi:hypothetical protein